VAIKGQGHGIDVPGADFLENGWRTHSVMTYVTLNVKVIHVIFGWKYL